MVAELHVTQLVYNALAYSLAGKGRQKVGVAAEKGGGSIEPLAGA